MVHQDLLFTNAPTTVFTLANTNVVLSVDFSKMNIHSDINFGSGQNVVLPLDKRINSQSFRQLSVYASHVFLILFSRVSFFNIFNNIFLIISGW